MAALEWTETPHAIQSDLYVIKETYEKGKWYAMTRTVPRLYINVSCAAVSQGTKEHGVLFDSLEDAKAVVQLYHDNLPQPTSGGWKLVYDPKTTNLDWVKDLYAGVPKK